MGLNTVSCDHRRLDDSTIVDSKEVAPRVILNYDARDQVVGIKLLRLSKRTPPARFRELRIQTARAVVGVSSPGPGEGSRGITAASAAPKR